jgi:DNA polymerase III delta prime subunit
MARSEKGELTGSTTELVLICGPAGVGKSSAAIEVSERLQREGVAHALIDTDELDRIYPVPQDLAHVTERNVAFMWQGFHERGIRRLILVGVLLDRASELSWIRRAIPDTRMTIIRLVAAEATLVDRIRRREIGSGFEAQLGRTREQLLALEQEPPTDALILPTDGATIGQIAQAIIDRSGWLATPARG